MIIKCKTLGLIKLTEVEANNRILVTQGLSIDELSKLWKWYYNIPPHEPIYLTMPTKLYNSTHICNRPPCKNVAELFTEQGIKVVEENF
jgi:hypothetical protein|nr:MAG TPA: hypothetical protein [Bacteriophage sp.]